MPTKRKPGRPKGSKNRKRPATKAREPRTPKRRHPAASRSSRSATPSTRSSQERKPSGTTASSTRKRAKRPATPLEFAQAQQAKLRQQIERAEKLARADAAQNAKIAENAKTGTKLNISEWLAGNRLAPDPYAPYARKMQLPKLPNGRMPGSGMAMDDLGPGAGGSPAFPYQGYFGLNSFSIYFPGYPYLAMLAQRTEYIQPVMTHAKDMTREWIEFTAKGKANKAKKISEIEERFEELNIQSLFRKAMTHDGFYGGGHIFIDLKGHDDARLPVLLDSRSIKKGSLRGFRNIEPMWVTPVMWNSSRVELPSFYIPETWWALETEMHKTRLLQVMSREVPDILKPAYNFLGLSLSQIIQPYVDRWLRTVEGVNRMINNYSLIVLKTNMSAILQDGDNGADLLKRLQLARMQGDNTGAFAVDKSTEDIENVQVSLSELAALQQQALEHMAYPTHEPLVVLTGVTPSGLNASSNGEIEVYHDWNRSEQNAVMRSKIKHVLDVVQLDMYGKIDPDISFKFKPIKQITGEVLANIKSKEAEQDVAYIDAGVVTPMEVREKVSRDEDSGFVNLDVESIPPELEERQESVEGGTEGKGGEVGGKEAGMFVKEAA